MLCPPPASRWRSRATDLSPDASRQVLLVAPSGLWMVSHFLLLLTLQLPLSSWATSKLRLHRWDEPRHHLTFSTSVFAVQFVKSDSVMSDASPDKNVTPLLWYRNEISQWDSPLHPNVDVLFKSRGTLVALNQDGVRGFSLSHTTEIKMEALRFYTSSSSPS